MRKLLGMKKNSSTNTMNMDDFLSAGCYTVKRAEGDGYSYIGYKDFVDDPEANPRESASGKLEIYCQYKGDMLNSMGYSPAGTFKPYPTYVASPEGREGMFADRQIGGAASEYPLIVYNPHYLRRAHGVMDNVPWLREAWSAPVFVSAADAAARGVADGDTVRVYSAHGSVLRTASVVEMLMPGCVGLPHGAWADFSKDDGIDVAGMDNVLCGSVTSGMGTSGYNNYNCNFEKYEGRGARGRLRAALPHRRHGVGGDTHDSDRFLLRSDPLRRLQDLPGGLQGQEPPGRGPVLRKVASRPGGNLPGVKLYHLSASCNHCESPACMAKSLPGRSPRPTRER